MSSIRWIVLTWIMLGLGMAVGCPGQIPATTSRSIALTIDDLPMTVVGNDHIAGDLKTTRSINQRLLKQLVAHHATAIGFVNEAKLNVAGERDARVALLEEWLKAGMQLGNHGYQHLQFSDVSLQTYEEEAVRGEVITSTVLRGRGQKERYFRHPYLDTGDTADKKQGFEVFLTSHHYTIAPVTVQNEDWMFNAPYSQARQQGNKVAADKIKQAYLELSRQQLDHAESLSRETFQREIPQVMLLHADQLNADWLGALLDLMKERGYRFITLEEAMADPVYQTVDNYVGGDGGSWLDRWQLAFGKPYHPSEPSPPAWVQQQYDQITAAAQNH